GSPSTRRRNGSGRPRVAGSLILRQRSHPTTFPTRRPTDEATIMKPIAIALLAVLVAPLHAQFEEDPRQKMKEILDQVAKEMTQIDQWLQESSRNSDARKGMARNVEQLNKLLEQAE